MYLQLERISESYLWSAAAQWSLQLADLFAKPLVLMHPRGHVIPALSDEPLATLRSFLAARAPGSSL